MPPGKANNHPASRSKTHATGHPQQRFAHARTHALGEALDQIHCGSACRSFGISLLYAGFAMSYFFSVENGGFGSLDQVAALLGKREMRNLVIQE